MYMYLYYDILLHKTVHINILYLLKIQFIHECVYLLSFVCCTHACRVRVHHQIQSFHSRFKRKIGLAQFINVMSVRLAVDQSDQPKVFTTKFCRIGEGFVEIESFVDGQGVHPIITLDHHGLDQMGDVNIFTRGGDSP